MDLRLGHPGVCAAVSLERIRSSAGRCGGLGFAVVPGEGTRVKIGHGMNLPIRPAFLPGKKQSLFPLPGPALVREWD